VLIACPTCRNRHVISDHLRIFGDTAMTVEDLLRERGELVKRGTLGEDGDLEFWEDGEVTPRQPWDDHDTSSSAAAAGAGGQRGHDGGEEASVDEHAPPGASFKSVKPGERDGTS
jgi:protein import protein ZIM17